MKILISAAMALRVEAEGGMGENYWDDACEDYEDVTKVYVRGCREGILSIKFEYVKSGKPIIGPNHGTLYHPGFTQTFEIDHATDEHLLSVEGYYKESTNVIQSVQFRTNMKTSDLMGFDHGTKFSLRASGKKIIGFHGSSGNYLNSLGAYFIKSHSIKSTIQGGTSPRTVFDDGGNFDGIRKVYVTYDEHGVRHIKFDYDKAGQVETCEHGVKTGAVYEFTVNHPNEYLASVEVTYDVPSSFDTDVLRSFVFKTSKGKTSPLIGRKAGKKFVLECKGRAIVGFHGRIGSWIVGLGAYYNILIPSSTSPLDEDSNQYSKALKMEAKGGNGGSEWDDGSNYEAITKIHVQSGLKEGLRFDVKSIKFDYAKDGKTFLGLIHDYPIVGGLTQTFEINHAANEYLLSVEGYYNESTSVIQSLKFKTNKNTFDLIGNDEGTKFSLRASGRKIIGFLGSSGNYLNSLGAYFIKIPSIKSAIQGGTTGTGFDDDGDFDGIRKVCVTHDGNAIRHIKFDYDKDGQVETREHGVKTGTVYEFEVNHPNEYLASVEVTYGFNSIYRCDVLNSFLFKTSKERTSSLIGRVEVDDKRFVLESKDNAIVGFHGRVGFCVHGLGAYYNPIPPSSSPPDELLGQGSN